MSEPDSFLAEVTEEVRRDRLVQYLRRNALWIGGVVVLAVGGAAVLEYRKFAARTAAEARGDAIRAALSAADPAAQAAGLEGIEMAGADGAAYLAMTRAAVAVDAEDAAQAVELLRGIAADGAVSVPLRDLARLKLVAAGAGEMPVAERLDILEQMMNPGHAMRGLALEQRALIHIVEGDGQAAATDLAAIAGDERAGYGVKQRAAQLMQAISLPGAGSAPAVPADQDG
ncbi:MAG: hypothetical protein AAGE76_05610 [Pseudomonadota bacterium]